jgi:CheY-like chemotaxis protein
MGVIFASLEILESCRTFAVELANRDVPIIVCSSVADPARARECGADYCLLHPFIYDNFSQILNAIASRSP